MKLAALAVCVFERVVALCSYKNRSPPTLQYIHSMQQVATEFELDWAKVGKSPDLRPLPAPLSERMLAVIDAMVRPDYEGPLDVLIPAPLVAAPNPVVIPRSYFVGINRENGRCIMIRQYSVEIVQNGEVFYRHREIKIPACVNDRYPGIMLESECMLDALLRRLFWDVLFDRWGRQCDRIVLNNPLAQPPVQVGGGVSLLEADTAYVRVVLQGGLMVDKPRIASMMVPTGAHGEGFTVLSRPDPTAMAVNAVYIAVPTVAVSKMVQHNYRRTVSNLESVYSDPQWRFPRVDLTAHELFDLVQLPVRKYYARLIQNDFLKQPVVPRLRMLARALHPKAVGKGCALGEVGKDIMARIVAFVLEDPKWGYP